MNPQRWERLKQLYSGALETPPERRAHFVAQARADDPELGQELEALLAADAEPTDTLDAPLVNLHNMYGDRNQAFREGDMLLGRFRIVRLIGHGGMGEVYEATDLHLTPGRIAIKSIRPEIAHGTGSLSRFKEEVVLARQVSGHNICRIYELYLPPAGAHEAPTFLTMEFLEGVTLAERIATNGPIAPKKAITLAAQLCSALQSIHDARIVHRDLKPRNIMLGSRNGSEQIVVMDFGLAHALATASPTDETGLTAPGTIMGTPQYMAPEQFEGGDVTPATDIYALGIILYEMVTGKHPFVAHTPVGAAVRRARRPDSPSSVQRGVPHVWDDVIAKCLEYEPQRRYQSAKAVIDALNEYRFEIGQLPQGPRIALTRRGIIAAAAISVLLLSISGWSSYRYFRIHRPPPEAKRWYDEGAEALRDNTYLKAVNALEMAVKVDRRFALAHARLAEAWSELDSTGKAQEEMLLATAPEQQNSAPDEDRAYVDAVRATLVRDYSAAAQDYERILEGLPDGQKADGMVDLGRAYEKAGKLKETIASYESAAKMRPDDPAPYVHLGIWKSRQRDPAGAEVAFTRAEELYRAESNQEGLAEVAYQRGYAANEAADSAAAHKYLEESLTIARQIDSPQLRARSLTQLSSVEYYDGEDDKAIDDANQAITIAEQKNLEYWKADGRMRLGNAYLHKQDFANAEVYSVQAFNLAQQNHHPRIEADAAFTLASIRDLQGGQWDEQIALAREARKYYGDFGFMNMAASSFELVVRGEQGKGDLIQAYKDGNELLYNAETRKSDLASENAEETLGSVLGDLQEYPDALGHFEKALALSQFLHDSEAYKTLDCADILWRLGRYNDAEKMLAPILADHNTRSDVASGVDDLRAQIQLSKGQYQMSLETSQNALRVFPDLTRSKKADLLSVETMAETQLGQSEKAEKDAVQVVALAREERNENLIASAELLEAVVALKTHHLEEASTLAEAANAYFSTEGQRESEWLSLFYIAEVARGSGDIHKCRVTATQALKILGKLEQAWGNQAFDRYTARPDHQLVIKKLQQSQQV